MATSCRSCRPEASVAKRAAFMTKHLWVTPYDERERTPRATTRTSTRAATGCRRWTAADRPIDETDVVLWYTFGEHHVAAARRTGR